MLQNIGIRPGNMLGIDINAELEKIANDNALGNAGDRRQGAGSENKGYDNIDSEYSGSDKGQGKFFRTTDQVIYGFANDGKIYIDKSKLNPNTLVHEYTHLWCDAVKQGNPELWNNIKDLVANDELAKVIRDELLSNSTYKDLSDDEIVSEVVSRLSGKQGRERLEKIQAKLNGETKGLF